MIQHIVLLKLKAGTTEEQKQALLEGLVALQREHKIAGIESVSGGDNNSPEGKTHGFDWGFVMTFVDAAARDEAEAREVAVDEVIPGGARALGVRARVPRRRAADDAVVAGDVAGHVGDVVRALDRVAADVLDVAGDLNGMRAARSGPCENCARAKSAWRWKSRRALPPIWNAAAWSPSARGSTAPCRCAPVRLRHAE